MICLGPEHAAILGRYGVTREQVKEHLFKYARVPLDLISEEHMVRRKQVPAQYGEFDGVSPIPLPLAPRQYRKKRSSKGGEALHGHPGKQPGWSTGPSRLTCAPWNRRGWIGTA